MVEKDRSTIVNKTYQMIMLPKLYQKHLQNLLSESQLLFLYLIINVIQDIKNVKIEKIAESLPLPILFNSRRKKLQRFLSLPIFEIKELWFPIIREWIFQTFSKKTIIYLAIDRTNWNNKNLLIISVIYKKRAIPVYFKRLSKLGSSNFSEQKEVISNIIELFIEYKVVILGDREFCSVKLGEWLDSQGLQFCLRLKENQKVELENDMWLQLKECGLKPGISLFMENVRVTKTHKVEGFSIACKWKRSYRESVVSEGWFILTNMSNVEEAVAAYKKRFDIEEMFRDYKSGGYNLEGTNVEGQRFIALVIVISFAYLFATLQGKLIKNKGIQKYVARIKEYGRLTKRHSSFYIGLYAQKWIKFMDNSWNLVHDLMRLSRHKLDNYLRGIRAMNLILSTL